jgi:type I restriction enzyme, S subunit
MDWLRTSIANFCQTGSGGTPSRAELSRYYNGDIPWIKSGELRDDVLLSTEEHITSEALLESNAKLVPSGSVLVAMYGATVGRTAFLGIEAATNQAICHIVPDESIADAKFVWYALRSKLPELLSRRVGGAQPNINQRIIRDTRVLIPTLSEQRRIVEILDQADGLRKKRSVADSATARILPSLFLKLFGDPSTNPMGWKQDKLGNLAVEFRYGTSVRCDSDIEGLPVLRIPNIVGGELDLTDLKYAELPASDVKTLRLNPGDVLIVRTNGNPDYVGRCSVFDEDETMLFASYLIRIRLDSDKVNPFFVAAFLQTPEGRRAMAPAIRTTAGQSNINIESLRQITIPLPPSDAQAKFVEHLASLRDIVAKTRMSEVRLTGLFASLLNRAFSGELTAKWRDAHMNELLAESEVQKKALEAADSRVALSF